MTFDIVLVLYNSTAWLPECLRALSAVDYPHKDLHLIFVDNASSDDPGKCLEKLQESLEGFAGVHLHRNAKNKGFGAACNQGAALGTSENILFLNVDTEVSQSLFSCLEQAIMAASAEVAAFECRQLPYETGHHIDPVSLLTTWAGAAALAVRRRAFEKVNGFDEHLFMYCEDVDLSWRLRAAGYFLQYVPTAQVLHYSYLDAPEGKTAQIKLSEYAGSFYGNLLLRYKFGTLKDIVAGHFVYLGALLRPSHFENVRRVFAKNYLRHFIKLWPFLFWRWGHRCWYQAHAGHFDGGFSPDRGHCKWQPLQKRPLVSVIAYGFASEKALAHTLHSLQNQTYTHFEILLSDCNIPAISNQALQPSGLIIQSFSDSGSMNFREAVQNAKGEYICFLGTGQYFYPDHIELLLGTAEKTKADVTTAAYMEGTEPYALKKTDARPKHIRGVPPLQCYLIKRSLLSAVPSIKTIQLLARYLRETIDYTEHSTDIPRATSIIVERKPEDEV